MFVEYKGSFPIVSIIMTSLYELCELPAKGDFFLSFNDLLEVIRDASIKHKFSFKNPHKDKNMLL